MERTTTSRPYAPRPKPAAYHSQLAVRRFVRAALDPATSRTQLYVLIWERYDGSIIATARAADLSRCTIERWMLHRPNREPSRSVAERFENAFAPLSFDEIVKPITAAEIARRLERLKKGGK